MQVLLDQNIPRAVQTLLPGPEIKHASEMGWSELKNGDLLKAAEDAGFTAMITADQGIRYQQRLSGRQIALIVLSTNKWSVLRDNPGMIRDAIERVLPGRFEEVGLPRPPLRRRDRDVERER